MLSLCSCGQPAAQSQSSAEPGTPRTNLVASMPYEPQTLDPQYCQDTPGGLIIYSMYDRLVRRDYETGEFYPELAESWEISEDGLTYTFHLRQDVVFSDGEPLTAEDVVYTFERVDKIPFCAMLRVAESYKALDDYTVEVKLPAPAGYFLTICSNLEYSIVPKHIIEAVGDENFARNPVGSGVYKFVEWATGEKVVLTYNDKYWGEKPAITDIEIRKTIENTTALANLESGQVDMVLEMSGTDKQAVLDNPDLKLYETESTQLYYLMFNCQKAPFDDVRVRRAISMVLNRDEIVEVAANGVGAPSYNDMQPGTAGLDGSAKEEFPYDVEGAKKLLAEAGYPNGFTTTLNARNDVGQTIAQVIQAQLAQIGIQAELDIRERAASVEFTLGGGHNMCIQGSSGGTMEAAFEVPLFLHSDSIGSMNFSWYENPEFDELCDKAMVAPDGEREKLYAQAIEVINRDLPRVPLYYPSFLVATDADLKGYNPTCKLDWVRFNTLSW